MIGQRQAFGSSQRAVLASQRLPPVDLNLRQSTNSTVLIMAVESPARADFLFQLRRVAGFVLDAFERGKVIFSRALSSQGVEVEVVGKHSRREEIFRGRNRLKIRAQVRQIVRVNPLQLRFTSLPSRDPHARCAAFILDCI